MSLERITQLVNLVKSGIGEEFEAGGKTFIHHDEIEGLCNELFITNSGSCDWKNMKAFEDALPGSKIVALETDSFGWLVGGIKYEERIYSYG